jgi:hypothetical protein
LLVVLGGCASSPAEKAAATDRYIACLFGAADRLDDRKSDALTVAVGILPLCEQSWNAMNETEGQGMPLEAYYSFKNKMMVRRLETATAVVMQNRQTTR